MANIRVGLVGAGTMGALHARVVATGPSTKLEWVSDPSAATGRAIAERYGVPYLPSPDFGGVDAVIVAAPTQKHHEIALQVLRSGRPLLMEKPLANRLDEVDEILAEAEALDVPLMCGLLERFNPVVRTAFDLSRTPIHFRSIRHSPMTARIQTGVAGDLLIHDLDLALRLFGAEPSSVLSMTDSSGRSDREVEDVSEALLQFGSGELASLSASRRSQRKIRSMMITEGDRLIEVDLLRQDVTIYRHVFESPIDDDLGYRQQTIIDVPVLRHHGEPLTLQLEHFVNVIEGRVDLAVERATIRPPHAVLAAIVAQDRVR